MTVNNYIATCFICVERTNVESQSLLLAARPSTPAPYYKKAWLVTSLSLIISCSLHCVQSDRKLRKESKKKRKNDYSSKLHD